MPGKKVQASPRIHHHVFGALWIGDHSDFVVEISLRGWAQADHPKAWEDWNLGFPGGSRCATTYRRTHAIASRRSPANEAAHERLTRLAQRKKQP